MTLILENFFQGNIVQNFFKSLKLQHKSVTLTVKFYRFSNLHNLCSTVIYVSRLGLDNETEKPVSRLASGPVLLYYEFCEQKKWHV